MFCDKPAGVMDQEQQYLAALQNAATYEISGSNLTIRDAGWRDASVSNGGALNLRPAKWEHRENVPISLARSPW